MAILLQLTFRWANTILLISALKHWYNIGHMFQHINYIYYYRFTLLMKMQHPQRKCSFSLNTIFGFFNIYILSKGAIVLCQKLACPHMQQTTSIDWCFFY